MRYMDYDGEMRDSDDPQDEELERLEALNRDVPPDDPPDDAYDEDDEVERYLDKELGDDYEDLGRPDYDTRDQEGRDEEDE